MIQHPQSTSWGWWPFVETVYNYFFDCDPLPNTLSLVAKDQRHNLWIVYKLVLDFFLCPQGSQGESCLQILMVIIDWWLDCLLHDYVLEGSAPILSIWVHAFLQEMLECLYPKTEFLKQNARLLFSFHLYPKTEFLKPKRLKDLILPHMLLIRLSISISCFFISSEL